MDRAVIIGGSSGIGLAVADVLLGQGAAVTVAGRSPDRLASAERTLVSRHRHATLRLVVADASREENVERLFKDAGPVEHVVLTAADASGAYQRVKSLDLATARHLAARLPAGRVGTPGDVAQAVLALIGNPFMTGTVVHVDGGQRLV